MVATQKVSLAELLQKHDPEGWIHSASPVLGLTPELTIAYVNDAWSRFAADNDGQPAIEHRWGPGAPVLEAIPPVLRGYYESAYRACLQTNEVWSCDFECSSPQHYRRFRQLAYPLRGASGLLVVYSLVVEQLHEEGQSVALGEEHVDDNGIVHQCCHCRRINSRRELTRWDWIPALVAHCLANVSHDICPNCLDHYYPEPDEER